MTDYEAGRDSIMNEIKLEKKRLQAAFARVESKEEGLIIRNRLAEVDFLLQVLEEDD